MTRDIALTETEAAFLIQSMVTSRSREVSEEAQEIRKRIAGKLELIFPGVVVANFGTILLTNEQIKVTFDIGGEGG